MEFWIILVVIAQFFQAIVVLLDKYLVTSPEIPRPAVYAFYVGALSIFPIVLLPSGLISLPSFVTLKLSAIVGFTFIGAILFLYTALKWADATDVAPFLGAITAGATFFFSLKLLQSPLPEHFVAGIVFLIVGMLFVAHFRFHPLAFVFVVFSGLLFALSSIYMKIMFNQIDFMNAFFWSRMANFVAAMCLLLWPPVFKAVFSKTKRVSQRTISLVVGNKILSSLVFLVTLFAIKLGDVSIVNALQGLQFVFLFIIVGLLGERRPRYVKEVFRPGHILHKWVAIVLITSGLFVLFI
ncbi:MAG: hypothetical protein Q8P86_02025 [bacterium]|nr:hypothetical protein [bacterium]